MSPSIDTPMADAAMPDTRAGRRQAALALPFDVLMLVAVLGLCGASLLTISEVTADDFVGDSDHYLVRQGVFFGVGLALAALVARLDYTLLRRARYAIYGAMLVAIVAVQALGEVARGSRRAIDVGFFSFQASELGKVLLVVAVAAFLLDRPRRPHGRETTVRVMLLALFPAALVIVQPDLGSGMVYLVVGLALLFVAGASWRHFAGLLALGAAAVTLTLLVAPLFGVTVLHDNQKDRLVAFLQPSDNPRDEGYQQNQSRIAVGAGGKTGRGDQATQTTLNFLPEHHTDFIFASLAERRGFVGAAFVLSMYALLIWRGLRTLTMAKDLFGALVAGGVVAMLMFQVFVNIGMNVGIMPITGIPLPLLSYGGSSVLTTLLGVGLLQSIYAQGRASAATKGHVRAF